MSKQKIKLEVEGLKMEPLKFFMNKQGKDLEKEIVQEIDKMYEKYVPSQTREFIDHQLKDEEQEEIQETESTSVKKKSGSSNRRRKTQSATNIQADNGVQETAAAQDAVSEEAAVQEAGMVQQM